MSITNLVKDMTKREMYVLVLVSGMLQDADASWLEKYGDNVIKAAELMADKMLLRGKMEFIPTPFEGGHWAVREAPSPVTVEVAGSDLGSQDVYEEEVVGTVETVTEEVSEEDLDADGRRC